MTYFRRNPGRTLPLAFVIVLSVFLIASVVTIVNSIDLTVLTIYNYTRAFTPVIPRAGRFSVPPDIQGRVRRMPGVDRTIETSGFFLNVNTVFGKVPFICFAMPVEDRDYLLQRTGERLAAGRMPAPGMPEAVISEGLARNKKVKIGDIVGSPKDEGTIAAPPVPIKLVGILKGPTWIAFTSKEFTDAALPLVPHSLLATTRDPQQQLGFSDKLYVDLSNDKDRSRVEVFSFNSLVRDLRTSLAQMYFIMGLVNGTVIFVVALMAGMLSNIYFTQRISEFATLAAIGLRRSTLIRHAVSETAILTSVGWIVGVLVNFTVLSFLQGRLFEPRGMLINPRDLFAYAYTLPIPLIITLFAVATIGFRLSRLDPVTIIERR